jgi:hypothetical protein
VNSRHAAALALVASYLIIPPAMPITDPHVEKVIDGAAPFAQWPALRRFEKASECGATEESLHINAFRLFSDNLDSWDRSKRPELPLAELRFMQTVYQNMVSQCVSTDDPRLTGTSARLYHSAVEVAGRYLMAPPMREPNAPLSEWMILDPFDSADACKRGRSNLLDSALKIKRRSHALAGSALWNFSSLCIATDDPRLKEK